MSEESQEQDLFEKYSAEFVEDTKLNEMTLKERAMTIVAVKHKWVGRLMRHKIDLKKLENAKKQAIKKVSASLSKGNVELTKTAADKAALNNELVQRIDAEVEKIELVVEYLEKVERILNSMTYDIKNLIDIQKLETL